MLLFAICNSLCDDQSSSGYPGHIVLELGDTIILSFVMILKCHDNRNQRKIFNIANMILP